MLPHGIISMRIRIRRVRRRTDLQPGTKVHHFVFGDGVVVEIDSAKEAHLIQFEGMDTPRRLSVRAKLEIIKKEVKQE